VLAIGNGATTPAAVDGLPEPDTLLCGEDRLGSAGRLPYALRSSILPRLGILETYRR